MEAIIAKAVGVMPQEIWPSRYNEDGTPKRGINPRYKYRARNKNMAQPGAADNVEVSKRA